MNITEIAGKNVKLSKGSITVLNDNDKTCGVVRNLTKWKDIQANKQIILRNKIKSVWGKNNFGVSMERVYFDLDNNAYIIKNTRIKPIESEQSLYNQIWGEIETDNNITIIEVGGIY